MTIEPSLHDRLNRILHWDVNVSDLERSVAFYEAVTPFRASEVVEGRTRSVMLENPRPGAALPRLRLVQWVDPAPVGRPSGSQSGIGFYRIVLHVADIDLARATATALGSPPFAPTTGDDFLFDVGSRGELPFHVVACHDPDGTVVEFIQGELPKLSVVAQWTSALDELAPFFTEVLGLDLSDTVRTRHPVPDVYGPRDATGGATGGATVDFRGLFFRVRGDDRGYLDWLEPRVPHAPVDGHELPNRLGPISCAFEVDDIDAAVEQLAAARWAGEPLRIDHGPLEVDFGGALGRRRMVTFRDPEGVIYRLVAQERRPPTPQAR